MKNDKKSDDGKRQIASQIAYNRIKRGLTQQQLADRVGTTKSGISRLESGKQNISYEQIFKIAQSMDMTASFVMEDLPASQYIYSPSKEEYYLKQYDDVLVSFSMEEKDGETKVCITKIYNRMKNILPLGFEVTNEGLKAWLLERAIPKNREFVGAILQAVGLKENNLKAVIDICKALSLNDSYWVVPKEFDGSFDKYNLYDNDFSQVLSLVSYTGYPYKEKNFMTSPEFTTGGMLRKAWRRKEDGIWLYKGGSEGFANAGKEPYSEFLAAQVGKAMGLNVVEYELENWKGILASKCKLFSSKDISYVPIGKIVKSGGIKECLRYYKALGEEYYQDLVSMLVFDAIILNEDRHYGNFGLLRDNTSGKILGTAPVFDNGSSLLVYGMENDFQTEENLSAYTMSRRPYGADDFFEMCKGIIGPKQKKQLKRLIGFKFTDSEVANLSRYRIAVLEELIQKRVQKML